MRIFKSLQFLRCNSVCRQSALAAVYIRSGRARLSYNPNSRSRVTQRHSVLLLCHPELVVPTASLI